MAKNELKEPSIDFGFGRVIYKEQKDLSKYRVLNLENESLSLIVNNKGKLTSFLQGAKFNNSLFSKEYKDVDLYWVCPENGISYYDSKKFELKLKYVDKKYNSSKLLSFNYFFKYKITSPIQFISKIIVKSNSTRETYTSDLIINLLRNKVSFDELIQDNVQQIINNCTTLDEVDDKLKKFNLNELNDEVIEYGIEIRNIKFDELALDELITKEEALKAKEDCINEVAENMKKEITDLKSDVTVGFSVIKNDVDSIKSNQDSMIANQEEIKSQSEAVLNNQPKNDLEDSQLIKEIINQQKELSDKLGAVLSNQEKTNTGLEAANSKLDQSLDNDHVIIANQEKQNSKLDRIESKISSLHDYFKDREEEQKEFKNQLTQLLQNNENIKELFEKQNLPAIPAEIIDKPLDIKKFIDEHYDEIVDSITLTPEFLIDAAKNLDDFCLYASLIYHSLENSLLNKYHLRADKTRYYFLEDEIKEIYSKLGSNYQIGGYDNSGNLNYTTNQNGQFKFNYLIPNKPKVRQFYNRHNLNFNESKLYENNDPSFKFAYAYEDENHPENKRYNIDQAKFIGHLMSDYNSLRHQSEECKTKRNMMLNNYKNKNSAKVSGYDDVEVMKMMCIDHLAKLNEYKAI